MDVAIASPTSFSLSVIIEQSMCRYPTLRANSTASLTASFAACNGHGVHKGRMPYSKRSEAKLRDSMTVVKK